MTDISSFIISEDMPIIEAMSVMDRNSKGTVFLCNNGKIIAALTDGDIRRYILKGKSLSAPASEAAFYQYRSAIIGQSRHAMEQLLCKYKLRVIPVLNESGIIVDVYYSKDEANKTSGATLNVPVVIMAGGKGTRLHPYTKVLPKPLIPIGEITITEHIMNRFLAFGCGDFTMIVNHKKNMIKAFFADEQLPYQVKFEDEDKPLGTGGGLKLLQGKISDTFFMTNCDILVFEDYAKILDSHKSSGNLITMVCATKSITIPYGTVEIDKDGKISSMIEKPTLPFLTNTGFYIIEPEFMKHIKPDTFTPMTDSIQTCIDDCGKVGIYPISDEQWADMGQLDVMEKMREGLKLG